MEALDAKGVAVTIDSTHQCMTMRGIKKEQATTVTNFYLGQFKEDLSYQNRYLRFISIVKRLVCLINLKHLFLIKKVKTSQEKLNQ